MAGLVPATKNTHRWHGPARAELILHRSRKRCL